jgi:hypothetical protein
MQRMFRKFIVSILKVLEDERGIDPITVGALVLGGGALLGGLGGKSKMKTIDPYAQQRDEYKNYLSGKLGTSTPYTYNEAFTTDQPDIEKQVESTISGKLGNLPQVRTDIQDIGNRYYAAQKTQMEDRFATEQEAQKNMYNRLGLVSSTPGLAASTDLGRKQENELSVLSADVARQGIDQEMAAQKLSEDIANQWTTQGQQLGNLQRGYQQESIRMSEADIERMTNEELAYASLMGQLINGNPPEYYYKDNWAKTLGNTLTGAGTSILSAGIGTNKG